jgi:peptidoglycan-associated lipoprotein
MLTTPRGALLLAALLASLSACDTPSKLNEPSALAPVEIRDPTGGAAAAGGTTAAAATAVKPVSGVASVDLASTQAAAGAAAVAAAASQRIVYFDFDSFVIKDDYKGMLDAHARVLSANKAKGLVIEGHTDERGGREYNLALGQKRAEAVLHALELLGAGGKQLEAVSFGEERPAAPGSDEAAWSRNRRAELKDR